jgi:probable rRNA maturation factor
MKNKVWLSNSKDIKIKKPYLKRIINLVLKKVYPHNENLNISFHFVDNKEISILNKKYLNKNEPTDVLSFPVSKKFLGDVVISVEEASINAKEYKVPFYEEVTRLIVHGILHLKGYRDKKEKERKIMWKIQENIIRDVLKEVNDKKSKKKQ